MKNKSITPPLRSIKEELAACRKAWKPYQMKAKWTGKLAWCCHHTFRIEAIAFAPTDRISHIMHFKTYCERAARLRSFRPVKRHPLIAARLLKANKACWGPDKIRRSMSRTPGLALIHDKQYPGHAWRNGRVYGT